MNPVDCLGNCNFCGHRVESSGGCMNPACRGEMYMGIQAQVVSNPPQVLQPGTYRVVDGQLYRVIHGSPPYLRQQDEAKGRLNEKAKIVKWLRGFVTNKTDELADLLEQDAHYGVCLKCGGTGKSTSEDGETDG